MRAAYTPGPKRKGPSCYFLVGAPRFIVSRRGAENAKGRRGLGLPQRREGTKRHKELREKRGEGEKEDDLVI